MPQPPKVYKRQAAMKTKSGYVDLQVNGFAGVDFNDERLHREGLAKVCQQLDQQGVVGILATIITDDLDKMCRRLTVLRQACEQDKLIRDIVWGLHIEGPFISPKPGFVGAHPADSVRPADVTTMERLLDAGGEYVKLVTLAPEQDPSGEVIRLLVARGVRVSAGHTDASINQLLAAIDAGLSMFTHLGNGCPITLNRHDNIIQRVLSLSDRLAIGFIADGVHIPPFALRNYLKTAGIENAFVVTDATQAAGLGPGRYLLAGQEVVVDEQLATWSRDRSHLVGSAMTIPAAAEVLRTQVGLTPAEIEQLTSTNPRRLLLD
jgi:N-acetylglucosamine-6-phosphate deacetylase